MKPVEEVTYDEAAKILRCSPRHVRRVLRRNGVKPIVRGHRTVRFPLEKVARLQIAIVLSDRQSRKHTNGGTR